MAAYLLDANIISYFLNTGLHGELAGCAAHVALEIVDEVREEITSHRTLGRMFARWLPDSPIRNREITVGSAEHARFVDLCPDQGISRGKGERASIAVASLDASLTFVANDKNALWLALREIHRRGGTILGVPVFLLRMMEDAGLSKEAATIVMEASGAPSPTWWRPYLASPTAR